MLTQIYINIRIHIHSHIPLLNIPLLKSAYLHHYQKIKLKPRNVFLILTAKPLY